MTPTLISPGDLAQQQNLDLLSDDFLFRASAELLRFESEMRTVLDPLFSSEVNRMAEYTISTETSFYDDLVSAAVSKGASADVLTRFDNFIEGGMTRLVHTFSEYFDDDALDRTAFIGLLNSRRSEAVWDGVFTFYFNQDTLTSISPSEARTFVSRFWDCFLAIKDADVGRKKQPYYERRIWKIYYENIYASRRSNPKFIEAFEKYTRDIAKDDKTAKGTLIEGMLGVREWGLDEDQLDDFDSK